MCVKHVPDSALDFGADLLNSQSVLGLSKVRIRLS